MSEAAVSVERAGSLTLAAKRALDASAPAWAGEYQIAQRYFGADGHRNAQTDLFLVEQQMYKEWHGSGLYGPRGVTVQTLLSDAAQRMQLLNECDEYEKIDRVDSILGILKFAGDELRHYRKFAELRMLLTAEEHSNVSQMGKLREGKALTELRYAQRETEIGLAAVRISESAGLSFFFGTLKALGKDPARARNAVDAAFITITKGIIADEHTHIGFNFHHREVVHLDEDGWADLGRRLRLISLQKLRERNEQCGYILSDAELQTIERGENNWLDYARNCPGYALWYEKLSIPRSLLP